MGGETYDVLCNKLKAEELDKTTYDQIVALLKAHFSPTPLEILENFKFNCRKQLENESLKDYVTDLEKLAQTCNFGDHFDNAIRNQFVFGLRNRAIQSRLLEIRDLTLAKAKDTAFGMEMSHRGTDEMHGSSSSTGLHHVEKKKPAKQHTSEANKHRSSERNLCYRCGDDDHLADECEYRSVVCRYCKKKGHLEKVCLKKRMAKETNLIEDDETVHVREILRVDVVQGSTDKFLQELQVNGKRLSFEVDTGSAVSLISAACQRELFPKLALVPTSIQLEGYCGVTIKVLGKAMVEVSSGGDLITLPLHVVDSTFHPLLGRDWLHQMEFDFNRLLKRAIGQAADN